jgi:hypothetical protein
MAIFGPFFIRNHETLHLSEFLFHDRILNRGSGFVVRSHFVVNKAKIPRIDRLATVGTVLASKEMVLDAASVETMPTTKRSNVTAEVDEANGTCGNFEQFISKQVYRHYSLPMLI